jgi:NAD(P)-dependent dehydrogenase (short-subunit alcohol dehydrogenase family)
MSAAQTQRVALVTGAGSGMGEATAKRFAQDGMAVGALDINAEAAQRVADVIKDAGGRALALTADVSSTEQCNAAAATLRAAFGGITVLVNNAAIEDFGPFESITERRWDRVIEVNLKSIYILTQAVVADMIAAKWGRIINISALGAQLSTPNMSHYYAAKGGVISLTRALAADLGPKGVTVNSVSPGFIDTPMSRRAIADGLFPVAPEVIYGAYPVPRLGTAEEIAHACAFFASEQAGYVTAQLLGVNGGAAV